MNNDAQPAKGEVVNPHVMEHVPEPRPDFDAMRGTILPRKGLRVVAAAVLLENGAVICGVRHFDKIMCEMLWIWAGDKPKALDKLVKGAVQGFVTNDFEFVSRDMAWLIAVRAGQFEPKDATGTQGTLYSEDVW